MFALAIRFMLYALRLIRFGNTCLLLHYVFAFCTTFCLVLVEHFVVFVPVVSECFVVLALVV